MSVLDDIIVGVREDLARRRAAVPEADLRAALPTYLPLWTRCLPSGHPASA